LIEELLEKAGIYQHDFVLKVYIRQWHSYPAPIANNIFAPPPTKTPDFEIKNRHFCSFSTAIKRINARPMGL